MAATTITHSAGCNLTTDAAFRAYYSAISAAIATADWTQTADTGQVNWTTVTVPAAGTAPALIYEVWRLNDSLQATDPVFIKVMYSRSASNGPYMRIIAGTASDGAGTITSAANTGVSVAITADVFDGTSTAGSSTSHKSYVNGDGSSLVLFLSPNQNSTPQNGGLFVLERKRASDGTPAAGGFTVTFVPGAGGGTVSRSQCVYTNSFYAQPSSSTSRGFAVVGALVGTSRDNGVKNNVVPAYPVITGFYPELGAPSKYLLAVYRMDVPLGQTFQVSHYGATQTFMSVGSGWVASASTSFDATGSERVVPAVRID